MMVQEIHSGQLPDFCFPVFLAPMAGITDLPFRSLVLQYGAGLVTSEMIACRDIVTGRLAAQHKSELGFGVERTVVQLAGYDTYWMAEAARLAEANGAKFIDINMGCPAKKVVGGYAGSALLRDLGHALKLIEAVVKAVKLPVTVKTRLGWDETSQNARELARQAENAGIVMITIHCRTRNQFFKGSANWSAIRSIKKAVNIPVIVNGDVTCSFSAQRALEFSSADGVMVGRGARGQPWILAKIANKLFNSPKVASPKGNTFCNMVSHHYEAMLSFYGTSLGSRVAKKHLGWYMDTALTNSYIRKQILTATTPARVLKLLPEAFHSDLSV